jgi:hypothetical protein
MTTDGSIDPAIVAAKAKFAEIVNRRLDDEFMHLIGGPPPGPETYRQQAFIKPVAALRIAWRGPICRNPILNITFT